MLAVVCNIFGVMLNHDDRFSIRFIQLPQHLINAVCVPRIQLGDGLVQNQDFRSQRHRSRQRQQVGLPSGKLPDVFFLPAFQPALMKRLSSSLLIICHAIIQAGIGGVVQHRRTDDLIFKVLIHISHLAGESAHIGLQRIFPVNKNRAGKFSGDKMWNQSV